MPVFHFLLTDTVTGEKRYVDVAADNKDEAEETVYRQEMKKVNFVADESVVKDLEAKLKEGTLSGADKAKLYAHRQEKPYTFQKAKKEDD